MLQCSTLPGMRIPKLENLSGAALTAIAGASAGVIAATWNAWAARRAERKTPPVGEFVEIDSTRLHYLRAGQGPTVVLIHGNGTLIQDWQISGVFGALSKDHEVIAFDRPGFGYSSRARTRVWTPHAQAEVVVAALKALRIGPAIVVGHSFGALVAAQIGLDHPEVVSRLVLVSGYYYPGPRVDGLLGAPPALPVVGDVLRYTISPLLGRAITPLVYRQLFQPADVAERWQREFPREMALRPSQVRAVSADGAVMVPGAATLAARYGDLKMPVTIVTGDGDRIVGHEGQSLRLHDEVRDSRLVVVEGAGHMVHHIDPAQVTAAISG
jgi:pimeloyl-ACP methyl ester carboxylesterase